MICASTPIKRPISEDALRITSVGLLLPERYQQAEPRPLPLGSHSLPFRARQALQSPNFHIYFETYYP